MEEGGIEAATKLPPIQYSKLRGLYPQKVYAALRGGRLEWETCDCGRRVVSVDKADRLFKVGKHGDAEAGPGTGSPADEEGEAGRLP